MDGTRDRLAHVLWIGGGPHAGKTTLSRLLAGKWDLKIYNVDWHLVREHAYRPEGILRGWGELTMDERWVDPSAEAMAERDLAAWTGRSGLVIEDLLAWPAHRTIVVEGPSVFPWWVAPLLRSPRQAIFLIPSPEWRAAVLERRFRDDPAQSIAGRTTHPERARRNMAGRDAILGARVTAACAELGLRCERVDGSRDLDDSLALLEEQFRPFLPATPNV